MDRQTTNRRSLLKKVGAIVGTAAFGGAGLLATTGGARASGGADYDDVSLTTDAGKVNHVSIYGDSIVNWDGFDTPAQSFEVVSTVTVKDPDAGETIVNAKEINRSGPHDLNDTSWGGDGESHTGVGTSGTIKSDVGLDSNGNHDEGTDWAIIQSSDYDDAYGLPTDPVDAAPLEVDGDGEQNTYTVTLTTTYVWYENADGSGEIFSEDFSTTFDLTVKNQPKGADSSSDDGDDGVVVG